MNGTEMSAILSLSAETHTSIDRDVFLVISIHETTKLT